MAFNYIQCSSGPKVFCQQNLTRKQKDNGFVRFRVTVVA